ncbi:unnamed protein product [Umbelopsis ramanniana]
MAHRESRTHQTPPLPGNTGDDENSNSGIGGKGNHSEDHVHWDFDAPRFWDLTILMQELDLMTPGLQDDLLRQLPYRLRIGRLVNESRVEVESKAHLCA